MIHSRRHTVIAWVLVAIQFGLLAAIALWRRDPLWERGTIVWTVGWGLVLAGIALGLWGARHLGDGLTPVPLPNGRVALVTAGPYRWIRHPLYTAVMIGSVGIAITSLTPAVFVFTAVLIVFLVAKSRWEERHLQEAFDGYRTYAARTPAFVPVRAWHRGERPGSGPAEER